MRASIAHGIRPTALVLGKNSDKPWGKWDVMLAKAYQRFLNELCQQCGLPKYVCHTDDNRIQFKVSYDDCESSAVAERAQEDIAKGTTKRYGVRVYGEPYLTDEAIAEGLELSDFRRPYLLERAKKQGLIPDEAVSETTS